METQATSTTPLSVGLRFGLLTGLVSVIFTFILFVTQADQSPARWLSLAIFVGGMFMAHKAYKKEQHGYMSYSEGLAIGVILSGVSGVLSTAFSYVYTTFIDPEYMSRMMEITRAKMEEKGGLSEEQIDQAISMAQKFSGGGWMILFGIFGSLLIGLLIALVVSAVTKNAKPQFE